MSAADALAWLARRGTKKQIAELARYGITATEPFGVSVGDLKRYAKQIGKSHALAQELWASGRYEARMLAIFVDEPEAVTLKQMNAWVRDFDNWALVDTACFHLFDKTPHAWKRVAPWAKARAEFTKRTAFALIWSLGAHDRDATDAAFERCLPLIEAGAADERHLVEKAVDMALRAVGRRSKRLHAAAVRTAKRLAAADAAAPRRIGRHALRELESEKVRARLRG